MSSNRDLVRDFPGKRWVNVSLRTAHVFGVVLLGAALLGASPLTLGVWLTFIPGLGMLLIDTWANPAHLRETAGVGVIVKLILVALMALQPAWALVLFWLVLAISMLLSHAPGAFRHRQWL